MTILKISKKKHPIWNRQAHLSSHRSSSNYLTNRMVTATLLLGAAVAQGGCSQVRKIHKYRVASHHRANKNSQIQGGNFHFKNNILQLSSHVLTVAGIRVRNALQVSNNNSKTTKKIFDFLLHSCDFSCITALQ